MSSVKSVTSSDPLLRSLRPPLLHRVTTGQLQIFDYIIAGLLIFLTEIHIQTTQLLRDPGDLILVTGLSIATALAIALRRRVPMFALGLLAISTGIVVITGQAFFAEPLIAFAMYQVGSVYERRRSLPTLVAVCFVVLVSLLFHLLLNVSGNTNTSGNAGSLAIVASIAAWFVGDSVRVRRVYIAGLAEQAAQRQREIVERAQRSVAEERLQIARELHDVVAHSLSVIAVQSGVGRHVIDEHPGQAKKALAAVEETSRTALIELRRMLGILRHDDQRPASLAPTPSVSSLGQLIEQVRAAGVEVNLDVRSTVAYDLSPTANLAIYRIVQEALTNVVKHAGPASVNVELRDEPDELVLEITDDGGVALPKYPRPIDDVSAHHGIVGMRERVALFEGTFETGARPDRGYRVLARFPLAYLGSS